MASSTATSTQPDYNVDHLTTVVAAQNEALYEMYTQLGNKDASITFLETTISAKDSTIAAQDAEIAQLRAQLAAKDDVIAQQAAKHKKQVTKLDNALIYKDIHMQQLAHQRATEMLDDKVHEIANAMNYVRVSSSGPASTRYYEAARTAIELFFTYCRQARENPAQAAERFRFIKNALVVARGLDPDALNDDLASMGVMAQLVSSDFVYTDETRDLMIDAAAEAFQRARIQQPPHLLILEVGPQPPVVPAVLAEPEPEPEDPELDAMLDQLSTEQQDQLKKRKMAA
jgi:hypothetical protein